MYRLHPFLLYRQEAYAKIKEYYDGYHFCKESDDIYTPYSLLNALNDGKIMEFWFESGTSSSLMENLKHYPLATVFSYDGVKVTLDDFAMIMHQTQRDGNALVTNMTQCMYNGDPSGALLHLRSYIAGIPYDIITK